MRKEPIALQRRNKGLYLSRNAGNTYESEGNDGDGSNEGPE